ncbi:hypothetical protein AQS8620_00096 [Aquimixticola soesokkakensis]|uniref:Uncharacterized protein n=1 Tax=Aquimixticola soesokkakensis TaxID=1519096 RepID=A0A1Y5R870_9RHOB|nr:hypothetical protein [Aquimixticola soesokkakensis]SLN11342.1 hypothetical protein AQS8620_00096 [Aquimixticola soesokkakensis]
MRASGLAIVQHSIRQVVGNLDDALLISALPWLGITALQVLFSGAIGPVDVAQLENGTVQPTTLLATLFLTMASFAVGLWVAVEWHRFVLLGETATGLLPSFRGARIGAYLGKSLIIGVILLGVGFLASMAVGVLGIFVPRALLPVLMLVVMGLALSFVFYRLSPILPAAAMGREIRIGQAWAATAPYASSIFQTTLIALMMLIPLQAIGVFVGGGVIGVVYALVSGWITLMVGASLLTTIYGMVVEGRKIEGGTNV